MTTSRNAPCPCGSGKKYKKCCLSQDEARASDERRQRQEATQAEQEAFLKYVDDLEKLTNGANDHIRSGRWAEAEEACRQLEKRFPDEIDADHRFSEYYAARGDFLRAKEYAQSVVNRALADPGKYDKEMAESFQEAVEYFDECIRAGKRIE